MKSHRVRLLVAAAVALVALPALGYLPPVSGILKRMASQREQQALHTAEVRGTLVMSGEPALAAAAALGLPLTGSDLSLPALLIVKTPGRCRLELMPANVAVADRPAVVSKAGQIVGWKGLERVPAAAAMVRGVCALLGERAGDRAWAQTLVSAGISLGDVHLGRFHGRIAYVLGGRPTEARPQAWVDKQSHQPLRLVARLAGSGLSDVRLLEYGSPVGGSAFPRLVEVWEAKEFKARFTTEKMVSNPKVSDALF